MIKKIFICLFMLVLCFTSIKVKADTSTVNTGHSDIIELGFYHHYLGYKLLSDTPKKEIDKAYKEVKRKAFGWNVKEINNNVHAWYISDIIFSKSNKSSQKYTFTYSTKHTTTTKTEYSVSGSIGSKLTGKIKSLTLTFNLDTEGEITNKTEEYFEEKTDFSVDLKPYTKLSLVIRGDCLVSTGVGKNYILGIPVSKGTWEYITFLTQYYEFIEEKV